MSITNLRSYTISAGLAFNLECNEDQEMQNVSVSWTRVPGLSLESIGGIDIHGNALWFLPADLSHSASYSCLSRYDAIHETYVLNTEELVSQVLLLFLMLTVIPVKEHRIVGIDD